MYCGSDGENFGYIAEFTASSSGYSNLVARVYQCHSSSDKGEYYAFLFANSNPVQKLRFSPMDNTGQYARTIEPNSEFLIYQYVES